MADSAAKLSSNEPEEVLFYLSVFLTASDALRNLLARRGFDWHSWPSEEDRELLSYMREARRLVVHIQGQPDIEIGIEYVPYLGDNQYQGMHPAVGHHWFGLPGMTPPSISQRTYSFTVGQDEVNAVERCGSYVEVLRRLVQQFG